MFDRLSRGVSYMGNFIEFIENFLRGVLILYSLHHYKLMDVNSNMNNSLNDILVPIDSIR